MNENNVKLKKMANLIFEKFEKYWSEFSLILAIAVLLDPRYKLHFVDWSYIEIYKKELSEFEEIKHILFSLYDEYCSKSSIIFIKKHIKIG